MNILRGHNFESDGTLLVGHNLDGASAATITGLTSGAAQVGDHASIGAVMVSGDPISSYAWGSTPGGSEYGTGPNPTDYTASDGGTLYLDVVSGGQTFSTSAPVRYALAVNTVAPVASGDLELGDVLSVTQGTWTAAGGTYGYQWQRNGVDISGATATSYMVVTDDLGTDVHCVVTYTNSGGAVSAASNVLSITDVPAQMDPPTLTVISDTEIDVTLAADPADNGSPITGRAFRYRIAGSSDAYTVVTSLTAGSTTRVSGLAASTQYAFQARTANANGDSLFSTTVNATTQPASGASTIYVSPTGNDTTGDGSLGNPYATYGTAEADATGPGDTVVLMAGTHAPIPDVGLSGASGNPFTILMQDGAIIEGDLLDHVALGGAGGVSGDTYRDGIRCAAKSHIRITGQGTAIIRNVWRCGVFVLGDAPGTPADDIIVDGITIYQIGASAVRFEGSNTGSGPIAYTEDGTPRLTNVTVRNCTGYFGNIPNDYLTSDTETFSFANGIENFECSNNTVGSATTSTTYGDPTSGRSRGYGIDVKVGVRTGSVYGNTVLNHVKYGIYFDSARRWVSGVDCYNNQVHSCQIGIVMAREAHPTAYADYATARTALGAAEFVQELSNIAVYNNGFWNIDQSGIFLDAHPRDDTSFGDGSIDGIDVWFNSFWNMRRDSGSDFNLRDWENLAAAPTNVSIIGNAGWNTEGSITFAQSMATPPAWMTYTENGFSSDPVWTDAANGDFEITGSSPLVNLVDVTSIVAPNDLNGVSREGQTFADAGAFETRTADPSIANVTINSVSQDAAGDPLAISYTIDQNDSTVEVVMFAAATADPSASDFNQGGDGSSTYIDFGQVNMTTSGSPVTITGPDPAAGTGSYKIALLPTGGGDSDVEVSSAFTWTAAAAPASLAATSLGFASDQTSTTTPSFTVDLSGYGSGDRIIFIFGPGQEATALTVDGVAATLEYTNNGSSRGELTAFSYVLPGAGSASAAIAVTQTSALIANYLAVVAVEGSTQVDDTSGAFSSGGASYSADVTPAGTPFALIAVAMGDEENFGTHSWSSNVTQATYAEPIDTFDYAGSIATAISSGAAALQSITFTKDGASAATRSGIIVMAIS